jgi:hypothetical protein
MSSQLEWICRPPAREGGADELVHARQFQGLALGLAPTQSRVLRIEARIAGAWKPLVQREGHWSLYWGPEVEAAIPLRASFVGPAPQVTDVYWLRKPEAPAAAPADSPRAPRAERISRIEHASTVRLIRREAGEREPRTRGLLFEPADWEVDDFNGLRQRSEREVAALRRRALARSHASKLFFLELDELRFQIVPPCLSADEAQRFFEAMDPVRYTLAHRLALRTRLCRMDRQPRFAPVDVPGLAALSRGFERLAETHLSLAEDDGTASLWGFAFEQFAVDRGGAFHSDPRSSALLIRQGVPDGEFFLCFGELALLCMDQGVAPEFWEPRFPDLVRATHMFVEHRAPAGWLDRDATPYRDADGQSLPAFGYREGLAYPRRRRAELHAEYEALREGLADPADLDRVLRARFTRLVEACLRGSQAFSPGRFTEASLREHDHWPLGSPASPGARAGDRR